MQSMVPLPTPSKLLALLALLVTPQLQMLRWAIPPALFALAVIMEHPLLLVMLMLAIHPLDAKPVPAGTMLLLVLEQRAPLVLPAVTALALMLNAQVLVRSDHTQLVALLLYLVRLAMLVTPQLELEQ